VYEEPEKKGPSGFYEENLCLGKTDMGLGCSLTLSFASQTGRELKDVQTTTI
jgi:hypothetical protein